MLRPGEAPLAQLARYEALAEKAYDDMYDSCSPAGPATAISRITLPRRSMRRGGQA